MGSNKTFQQKGDRGRMVGESDEFRRLRRAIEKALRRSRQSHPQRLPPLRREDDLRAAGRDPGGDVGASWSHL